MVENDEEKIKWKYCVELGSFKQINKGTIKIFITPMCKGIVDKH
jgi:hypothetical protein